MHNIYCCFVSQFQQFFCHSTDIVMHSATKFIAGHSDLMGGILAVKGERFVIPVLIEQL
jgi:cystathionine beta-lyase/cystathionine gamma-synthase